jgi:dipeptidyl aminopeptidase/acylaminoacyl peptidase
VAFSPDGKTVASERRVWDAATGRVLATFHDADDLNNRNAHFFPIFYSPDGRQVITTEDEGARTWDIATGKEARWAVRARIEHERVALSRDGRCLATGGPVARLRGSEPERPIHLWELASGQEVVTLVGHGENINGMAFSADGRWLASGSGDSRSDHDATVRVWDVATGRELRRYAGHRGAVNAVAFAPDGRSLISGSDDGTGLVWDVSDLPGGQRDDAPLAPEPMQALWDALAGDDARAAHHAVWALGVSSAVAFLRERLRPAESPDPKGIPAASGPIAPPEVLRTLRAIAALEHAGTPEARAVLERMAQGNPGAIETREATSSMDRLRR